MADQSFDELVNILREYGMPFDREALRSAFNDPASQPAIQAWFEEYISPETLLSKDEATLYATLSKSGQAETLEAQDLSMIEGLNDREIQDAIEQLKRSTVAIEKQTDALRMQQNAMSALVKNEKRTGQTRSQVEQGQLRKWDSERAHVDKSVEDISQNLAQQVSDIEQQASASVSTMKQTVDHILKSDDKLLSSLQKLGSDLDVGSPENDDTIARTRELSARLIKYTVESIRTRLDRIYLTALGDCPEGDHQSKLNGQEITELQEELESLYSEILPVAQMSAEQQFLEPALRTISANDGHGQERAVKAVAYISDCLSFLIHRMETLLARAEEGRCHRTAINQVLDSAKKELAQSTPSTTKGQAELVRPNSQRRRKSSLSQPPIKTRNSHRRSSGEDLEPEQQLARSLGVPLPFEPSSQQTLIDGLDRILSERLTKLNIHASSLQSTTESSISSHLSNAHITLQLLQDSLLAETPYHRVRLQNPEIEASVDGFEQDVQYVQKSIEEIDLQQLQTKNVHRDQLIERWSR